MPKKHRAAHVAEIICGKRMCMPYRYVREEGTTPEAVLNLRNLPCRIFEFKAAGMHWLCAESAPVPLVLHRVAELLRDSLKREKDGYTIIYYRNLKDLPYEEYMRALHILRTLVRTCECETRTQSYKCAADCVLGFLSALEHKVISAFGVHI